MPKVTFKPMDLTVEAEPGETLLEVALRHGIPILHACGGFCACTTCQVVVPSGGDQLSKMDECEADRLERASPPAQLTSRLACQAKVVGDVLVQTIHLDRKGT
jgi:2Fe-2S ferredoxin